MVLVRNLTSSSSALRGFSDPPGLRETRLSHLAVLQPEAHHGGELVREDAIALFVCHAPDAGGEVARSSETDQLEPPFYGIHVRGALFHTQGGLKVYSRARVLRPDGSLVSGLYAGGGAAVGISGKAYKGYSSDNGLLAATVLGKVPGEAVAEELAGDARRA